ncbi:MAG: rod shape-determining protein RodA, partial [Bacteroidales bacterium]|nr:rod shape-determining protein RodA [Bacteroidales bacterium]
MVNTLKGFDWITAILYVILVLAGWFTINAASYNMDGASIFDFARVSGKQFVWFCLAFVLIVFIFVIDAKTYMGVAPFVYLGVMALLVVTIFISPNINGSHSWIKIGNFMSIQPAEFGKFSTSLMLAWLFNSYGFKFTQPGNFLKACFIVIVPILIILLQNETGSALVYFSMALLFYRQGMSGIVLWFGFCLILIFVIGVKYSIVPLPEGVILSPGQEPEPSRLGENIVLLLIPLMIALMLAFACDDKAEALNLTGITAAVAVTYYIVTRWIPLPFVIEWRWVAIPLCIYASVRSLILWIYNRVGNYVWTCLFGFVFMGFLYTADYAFHDVLQKHQRGRIEVLLGMTEDLKGAGYNVNQAKIAIGSGGLFGKGYLQGTQTKLSYVPEQETDFIFCTVGEEFGFVGSTIVLTLFTFLILRLIYLAERQRSIFAQVYGYCVVSIFFLH